jgi:hypothetical protein
MRASCLSYSVVASPADASLLPCRFSLVDVLFAAMVHYSSMVDALLPVLLVITEQIFVTTIAHLPFPVNTWPLWFLSSGCFTTIVVSASLVDVWPLSRLVLS